MHATGVSCWGRFLVGCMIPRQTFVGQGAHSWVIVMLSLRTNAVTECPSVKNTSLKIGSP